MCSICAALLLLVHLLGHLAMSGIPASVLIIASSLLFPSLVRSSSAGISERLANSCDISVFPLSWCILRVLFLARSLLWCMVLYGIVSNLPLFL